MIRKRRRRRRSFVAANVHSSSLFSAKTPKKRTNMPPLLPSSSARPERGRGGLAHAPVLMELRGFVIAGCGVPATTVSSDFELALFNVLYLQG